MHKRYGLLFGIVAAAAIFTLAACGDADKDDDPPPDNSLQGAVVVTGKPFVGEDLGIDTFDLNGTGSPRFQWIRGEGDDPYTGTWEPVNAANNDYQTSGAYRVVAGDLGKYIAVKVSGRGMEGYVVGGPVKIQTSGTVITSPSAAWEPETWIGLSNTKFEYLDGSTPKRANITGVVYGASKFVAVGEKGIIAYASDPLLVFNELDNTNPTGWKAVSTSTFDTTINAVAFGGGKFVAVGMSGKIAWASDPSGTWEAVPVGTGEGTVNKTQFTANIWDVTFADGKFIAVGAGGKMASSTDGKNWTAIAPATNLGTPILRAVAYNGSNKWLAVSNGGNMAQSSNGTEWAKIATPNQIFNSSATNYPNSNALGVAFGGNNFVVVGEHGNMAYSTDNGATWERLGNNESGSNFGNYAINSIIYANEKFVAVGANGAIAWSTNGTSNWNRVATPFGRGEQIHINDVAYDGTNTYVAVGNGGTMAYSQPLQ